MMWNCLGGGLLTPNDVMMAVLLKNEISSRTTAESRIVQYFRGILGDLR